MFTHIPEDACNAFLNGFEHSLPQWRQATLDIATSDYGGAFLVEDDPSKLRASPNITRSLLRLIAAIHNLGLAPDELYKYQIPRRLLEGFADRLASIHTERHEARQAAWDIALVRRLLGTSGSGNLVSRNLCLAFMVLFSI